jgi:predicted nucleotidyltransferase
MAQYGWTDCPESTRSQVEGFLNILREALGNNLVGVYLHGSLALGCFNPERSDIDVLVITKQPMTVETKRQLAEVLLRHSANPAPIEISILVEAFIKPWQYPTPYDFHYSEDWREKVSAELSTGTWKKWSDEIKTDEDLAAHITILARRGVALHGKPVGEVFPPVPEEHYIDSIVKDFGWGKDRIEQYPVNFILNAFRVCAFLEEGRICSKDEAGASALSSLGEDFRELVVRALEVYRGQRKKEQFDKAENEGFVEYMTERIGALLQARTDARGKKRMS